MFKIDLKKYNPNYLNQPLNSEQIDEFLNILAENEAIAKRYQEFAYNTPYRTPEGRLESGTTVGEMDYLRTYSKARQNRWRVENTRIAYVPYIPDNPTMKDLIIARQTSFKDRDEILKQNYLHVLENLPPDDPRTDSDYIEMIMNMSGEEFYNFVKINPEIWEDFYNYSPIGGNPNRREADLEEKFKNKTYAEKYNYVNEMAEKNIVSSSDKSTNWQEQVKNKIAESKDTGQNE